MTTLHWILVANGSEARIYAAGALLSDLAVVRTLDHPKSRMRSRELDSDDRGRTREGPNLPHSAMDGYDTPQDREVVVFGREVAEVLRQGLDDRAYERLIVVAPPRFLGVLRDVWSPRVAARVVASLDRDWTDFEADALPERLLGALPETTGMPEHPGL